MVKPEEFIRGKGGKRMETHKFEYIIKVNGKKVWRGLNPKEKYWDIKKKNPDRDYFSQGV